jgi:hypothetical protein
MAFSWDERYLVISGNGLRIRDVAEPNNVRYIKTGNQRIANAPSDNAVASSADGTLLATASGAEVTIRRAASGTAVARVRHPLHRESGNRLAIAFTATPHHLVTADSGLARVWDLSPVAREVVRLDLENEDENASFSVLSPDARSVATVRTFGYRGGRFVNDMGRIRLVKWLPEDIVASICERVSRTLTEDDWRLEFGEEAQRAQCPPRPSPTARD